MFKTQQQCVLLTNKQTNKPKKSRYSLSRISHVTLSQKFKHLWKVLVRRSGFLPVSRGDMSLTFNGQLIFCRAEDIVYYVEKPLGLTPNTIPFGRWVARCLFMKTQFWQEWLGPEETTSPNNNCVWCSVQIKFFVFHKTSKDTQENLF